MTTGESRPRAKLTTIEALLLDAARTPEPPPLLGYCGRIAHYRLIRVLGRGGMGAVYAAEDERIPRTVALKVLRATSGDAQERRRFLREARVLAELLHPAIVRHLDHGVTDQDVPYLAMEWVDGGDLAGRLARGPLPVREAVQLAARVAEALGAAHARGVIHRDLSPKNLLLAAGDPAGVKVIDFGLARLGQAPSMTQPGTILGTPAYMAPEQARAGEDVGPGADLFALGSILFECLTGTPAFGGATTMEVLAKILLVHPPAPGELSHGIPGVLDQLVGRLLEKDPARRPGDARAITEELRAIEALLPAGEAPAAAGDERASRGGARTEAQASPGAARSRSPLSPAGEQRLLCVAIAVPPADSPGAVRAPAQLEEAVSEVGGRIERLANGAMLLRLSGGAADQASRAARGALAMKGLSPGSAVVLVTGRSDASGQLPAAEVVERAMRMLARPASPASVRVDTVTRALLGGRWSVDVDGEGETVLLGEQGLSEEETPKLLGRPSPCVGRERELRLLTDLFEECATEGVARAVLVTAPAGAGKSRVRQELTRHLRRRGRPAQIWLGRGDPMRAGSAFGLIAPVLRQVAGIGEGEPAPSQRKGLRAAVERFVPASEAARVTELLAEITGSARVEENPLLNAARNDARARADQVCQAWKELVAGACAESPVLLVLEDLHWGDLPSIKLVDAALRTVRGPLLVLGLARPEVHDLFPRLWKERGLHEIGLTDLGPRAAERVARSALGEAADPEVVARVVERAGGNAFFLEELIRCVAEGHGDALPETILAMVESRILSLSAEERRLLRAGSVLGETFWTGAVARLLDVPESAVAEEIAALVDREVLERRHPSRFPGEEELAFRHGLLREGAYAMLPEDDRAAAHRLAASWLEGAGEGNSRVLAEHCDRGGEPGRAAVFYLRAAYQAMTGNDIGAAIACAERGMACRPTGDLGPVLGLIRGQARAWDNQFVGFMEASEEVLSVTAEGSFPWYDAMIGRTLSSLLFGDAGEIERAVAALARVKPAADATLAITMAFGALGDLLEQGSFYRLADTLFAKIDELPEDVPYEPTALGWLDHGRAARARSHGRLGEMLALFQRSAASFERDMDRRFLSVGKLYLGVSCMHLGAHDRAEEALRLALAVAGAEGFVGATAAAHLSMALASRGALDEALDEASRLEEGLRRRSNPWASGLAAIAVASVRLCRGELDEARRAAERALGIRTLPRGDRVWALSLLGRAALRMGRVEEAAAVAAQAREERDALERWCGVDGVLEWLEIEVLDAEGDRARVAVAIAGSLARQTAEAATIADVELRRSYLESVPAHAAIRALARGGPEVLIPGSADNSP